MDINKAICERKSCRAFLEKPVKRTVLDDVFEIAKWSPSGGNSQPWEVSVVTGEALDMLKNRLVKAVKDKEPKTQEFNYYPYKWFEPFKERRDRCGGALYDALGIKRDDKGRRKEQWLENYRFFNAPVVLFFFVNTGLADGALIDTGIFMQSVMLAARSFGLETCAQAALSYYPGIVKGVLNINESKKLLCGMSLGYQDLDSPVNKYRTERVEIADFVKWHE